MGSIIVPIMIESKHNLRNQWSFSTRLPLFIKKHSKYELETLAKSPNSTYLTANRLQFSEWFT